MLADMNDQPDATGPDRTADHLPTYSIAEMAVMLGVSTDAVRAHVNRGTLEGEKFAGVWRVRPPEALSLDEVHKVDRPDPTGFLWTMPDKPKGMHWKTYDRLMRELYREHERRKDVFTARAIAILARTDRLLKRRE